MTCLHLKLATIAEIQFSVHHWRKIYLYTFYKFDWIRISLTHFAHSKINISSNRNISKSGSRNSEIPRHGENTGFPKIGIQIWLDPANTAFIVGYSTLTIFLDTFNDYLIEPGWKGFLVPPNASARTSKILLWAHCDNDSDCLKRKVSTLHGNNKDFEHRWNLGLKIVQFEYFRNLNFTLWRVQNFKDKKLTTQHWIPCHNGFKVAMNEDEDSS